MIILKLRNFFTALLIAAMVFSLTACNSNLGIYINVKAGDVYKYHTLTSITSNTEIMGESTSTTQDTTTDFKVTIDSVDSEGNITMNYMFDNIKFESEAAGEKITYDSSNNSDTDDFSKVYKSIIGKGFNTKMTKHGEVSEVSGVDDLIISMLDAMELDTSDDANIQETKTYLQSSFGDNALKTLIQQSTRVLPENDVKIGDSWTIENTINSIVEINTKTTYTLDKIQNKIAHISVKSEFNTDSSKTHKYPGMGIDMDMTTDLTGKTTGTIRIDTTNGFLSEGEITQQMTGKMSVVVPSIEGSEEETVDIPMDSTSKVTYSITKM